MSNFQAVGTKAVVEGYSDFISQIQGMDRAVMSLGASLGRLPEPLRQFNTATTAMSKRMAGIGRSSTSLNASLEKSAVSVGAAAGNFLRATEALSRFVTQLGGAAALSKINAASLRSLSSAAQNFAVTKKRATQAEEDNTTALGRLYDSTKRMTGSILEFLSGMSRVDSKLKAVAATVLIFGRALAGLVRTFHSLTFGAIKAFGEEIRKMGNNLIGIGRNIQMFGRNLTFLISLPVGALLGGIIKSAIDFESAMAGVEKTVTLSDAALNNLSLGIRELSLRIPLAAGELAGLAEIGGQLGIDTFGGDAIQNLLAFTETIAAIGVSTNLAKEEAAEGFAQIIAIMGDAETDFVTQIESLGSSIVALGNNFSTTEQRILSFSLKIAGVANIVGLTQAETLAIAAAFTSVGVAAERGGTAVQEVLITMHQAVAATGDELEIVARVAGLTADQFAAGWTKGMIRVKGQILTTGDLFARFVEGLGQQADGGIAVLESLGLGNARLLQSFLSAAGAQGRMTSTLKVARRGYTETGVAIDQYGNRLKGLNALEEEAARRYATTASQITLFKNSVADLGITVGEFVLPVLNQLVAFGRAMIEMVKQADERWLKLGVSFGLFVAVLGPLVIALGLVLSSLGSIMAVVGTVLAAIGGLISAAGLLVAPFVAAAVAVTGLAIAFAASFDDIMRITNTSMDELSGQLYAWGHDLVIQFANGMLSAITAVINALIQIGNVIASWLQPGSPPRLLPDIDRWGAETMEEWMKGWSTADFKFFDDVSGLVENFLRSLPVDIMPEIGLIPAIMGGRSAVAEALEQIENFGRVSDDVMRRITFGFGTAGTQVAAYISTLTSLRAANQMVQQAQEDLNRTTERYRNLLKPINKELDDINDIRQGVVDAMRIEELNMMIADPDASAQVKELAALELRQIALLAEKDTIEENQAADEELANQRLEQAQAYQQSLEEQAAAQRAQIEATIENNRLIAEQIALLERLAESGGAAAGGGAPTPELDLGGITPFDASGLEDPFANIGQAMADRVTEIKKQVSQLFDDLKNLPAFQDLKAAWEKLGEVWAPIFIQIPHIASQVTKHLGSLTSQDFTDAANAWAKAITKGDWVAAATAIVDLLVPDSLPLKDAMLDGISGLDAELKNKAVAWGQNIAAGIKEGLAEIASTDLGSQTLASLVMIWAAMAAAVKVFTDSWKENVVPLIEEMKQMTAPLAENGKEIKAIFQGILVFLSGVVTGIVAFIAGIINGVIEAGATLIGWGQFIAASISGFFEGIGLAITGIVEFVGGIFLVAVGLFGGGWDQIKAGLEMIGKGLIDFFFGIISAVVNLGLAIIAAITMPFAAIAAFVAGWVEGVIQFFTNLYNALVGHSIIPEMMAAIQTAWTTMVDTVGKTVQTWVNGIIGFFTNIYDEAALKFEETRALIETKWDEIKTNIETIIAAVLTSIQTWAADVIAGITDPFTRFITETLPGLITDYTAMGTNIMQGVIDGIAAQAQNLIAALLGPLEDAWNAATSWLDEHSPSGRYKISGENIIRGYIVGMEDQKKNMGQSLVGVLQEADRAVLKKKEAYKADTYQHEMSLRGAPMPAQQAAPPTYLPAAMQGGTVDNSRLVNLSIGDMVVRDQLQARMIVELVRETIRDEMSRGL